MASFRLTASVATTEAMHRLTKCAGGIRTDIDKNGLKLHILFVKMWELYRYFYSASTGRCLRKPAGCDRHDRVSQDAQMSCQRQSNTVLAAHGEDEKIDVVYPFLHTVNIGRDVDRVPHVWPPYPLKPGVLRTSPTKVGSWGSPTTPRRGGTSSY